ncbi:MAG: WD40 repeat domain-containing protein [Chloroflexota bacterium]|nr:WD40 repeat domain-containing protein [Chloroflexota bacterium]
MTKQSLEMESRPWCCRVCGSANDVMSTHCFQCGHPGFFARSQRQKRSSLSSTRRNVLIGGLIAGVTLLGGGGIWFVRQALPGWARPISPTLEILLDPGYLPSPALAWSPDGLSIACSAAFDKSEREGVIVVDVKNGQKKWTYWDPLSDSSTLAWSPDGQWLALAGRSFHSQPTPRPFVQFWQVQGWQQLAEYPSASSNSSGDVSFQQLAWSPDKSRLAVALFNARTNENSMQIWRASDGKVLLTRQMPAALNLLPFMICWLPDSKMLATSGLEGEVDIWDTDTGESVFHHVPDHPLGDDPYEPLLFAGPGATMSPDRKQVALYTLENGQPIIQVWDISSRKLLFRCQSVTGQQGGLTWSPDGRYLAAYTNDHGSQMVHCWDARSGALSLTYGALNDPGALTWSPDGRLLAMVDRRQPFFLHAPPRDTVLRIFLVV